MENVILLKVSNQSARSAQKNVGPVSKIAKGILRFLGGQNPIIIEFKGSNFLKNIFYTILNTPPYLLLKSPLCGVEQGWTKGLN